MAVHAELRRGWLVVVACFFVAVHAWTYGFYGLSAFVAAFQVERGWSSALTSGATSAFYLLGAVVLTQAPGLVARLGPRAVLAGGSAVLSLGAVVAARAQEPWQLVAGFLVLGVGWACTSVAAISAVIGMWFDQRRGLAMSLALNGASVAGFTLAPALVWLADRHGLAWAGTTLALGMLVVVVVPLVLVAFAGPRPVHAAVAVNLAEADVASQGAALRSARFWWIAGPFALVIMAQVGLVVHLVSILLPPLGAGGAGLALGVVAVCAVVGRVGLGVVVDRIDQRRAGAAGVGVQMVGLALWLAVPGEGWALYLGCVLFGVTVGNNITLPPLLLQRAFSRASFGLVVGLYSGLAQLGYAITPGLFGVAHDATGGYGAVLWLALAMQGAGAVLLLGGATSPVGPARRAGRRRPG